MGDPRIEKYARLLVETCVDVQPGWQVLVVGSPLGEALVEEVTRQIARREAHALVRVTFGGSLFASRSWLREAPLELIATPASIEQHAFEQCDADRDRRPGEHAGRKRDLAGPPRRRSGCLPAFPSSASSRPRCRGSVVQFPTPAVAQDAGMSTDEFADFLYGACLLDWDAERERMQKYADRFDAADEVRIVGEETDVGSASRAAR